MLRDCVGAEVGGFEGEVEGTPLRETVTVSTWPAPFGPLMRVVDSVLRSGVGWVTELVGCKADFGSQDISVKAAPPMKSSSP